MVILRGRCAIQEAAQGRAAICVRLTMREEPGRGDRFPVGRDVLSPGYGDETTENCYSGDGRDPSRISVCEGKAGLGRSA